LSDRAQCMELAGATQMMGIGVSSALIVTLGAAFNPVDE